MSDKSFFELELKEGKVVSRDLSQKGLILSGFTIATLAFLFGLSREYILKNPVIIQTLFISLVIYFGISELARQTIKYWEYAIAEIGYIAASIFLFSAMLLFIHTYGLGIGIFSLMALLIFVLIVSFILTVRNVARMIKEDRKKQ
ncbi:hypothetical protein A3K80_06900 [Candidatus Bathyarchaeota archaeon RBG_13_38_9]|nr:MAG: hypothetical protein A3K80_06900 [Candidatus Bathyarchaeota archaeon RBG_13_38_9]